MPRDRQHSTATESRKGAAPWAGLVSCFRSAQDTNGQTMTLLAAVRYATGRAQRTTVQAIRKARAVAMDQADKRKLVGRERATLLKKSTENLKRGLWGFTPTGVYKGGRKAANAKKRTEAVMVEADHVGSAAAARDAVGMAAKHQAVMAAWVSPSGDGIKVLVWVQGGSRHKDRHAYATERIFGVDGPLFGVKDDTCYKNEHLLCFGSYDPDAHIRVSGLAPLLVPIGYAVPDRDDSDGTDEDVVVAQPRRGKVAKDEDDVRMEVGEMSSVLALVPPDCRHNCDMTDKAEGEARDQWIRVGMGIHSRLPGKAGLDLWDKWSRGGLGESGLIGDEPSNYDRAALRTSWYSFHNLPDGDGVSWATVAQLGHQWERANKARALRLRGNKKAKRHGAAEIVLPDLSDNPDILELVHYLVKAYFAQDCVRVLATGERMDMGGEVDIVAKRVAVEIRTQFKMQVSTSVVNDAVDVEQALLAKERRRLLAERVVGEPHGCAAGVGQVRRWLLAVAGKVDPLDEAILLHILRNVKLKLLGRHAVDHKSLILYQLQRSGKSTAINKLLGPLEELVYNAHSLKSLVDERGIRSFGKFAAIVWDEMAGARGRDTDESVDTLKALVTGHEVTYRPMGTNERVTMVNTATLFGSTNRPVADVIKDPTGNRRFWQITTLPRIDWDVINKIDYEVLWSAIGVKDKSPIADSEIDTAIMKRHTTTRYKDPVEQWTEGGDWSELKDIRRPGSVVLTDLPAVVGGKYYPTGDLYARFCAWCATNGYERPVNSVWFGRRLSSLGWQSTRRMVNRIQSYCYEAPVTL